MDGRPIWLVTNASSGSNADAALEALERCCGEHGLVIAHRSCLPDDELPTPAALDAAGVDRVAVFAGDGTINALIAGLAGWHGAVLVLAGGTMNLLYHRLHGERTVEETIAAVARGEATMRRPSVVRSRWGDAFAGVLAGPGTSWGRVREAMREAAVTELAASTVEAIGATLTGEQVACVDPPLGKPEGYPLLNLTPHEGASRSPPITPRTPANISSRPGPCSSATFAKARTTCSAAPPRCGSPAPRATPSAC